MHVRAQLLIPLVIFLQTIAIALPAVTVHPAEAVLRSRVIILSFKPTSHRLWRLFLSYSRGSLWRFLSGSENSPGHTSLEDEERPALWG